jgi:hypothetical protein
VRHVNVDGVSVRYHLAVVVSADCDPLYSTSTAKLKNIGSNQIFAINRKYYPMVLSYASGTGFETVFWVAQFGA